MALDPFRERNILELVPDDVLKIALRPGYHVNPTATSQKHLKLAPPSKPRRAVNYSRIGFLCQVIDNDIVNRILTVDVQDAIDSNKHLESKIPYGNILYIQLYFTGIEPMVESAPISHPGAKALGSKSFFWYQRGSSRLVKVTI